MKTIIHVDDYVSYRGGFGADAPKQAMITGLTLTKEPRDKYGVDVSRVCVEEIEENRVLFSLDDGHWAYSDQIDGWVDTTIGVTVPLRPEVSLNEDEVRDLIDLILSNKKLHTDDRYEVLMQKLLTFTNKERLV